MTAAELVDWYLVRIEVHGLAGAELQAAVPVNPRARDEAIARDEFLAAEDRLCGPLHGVPVLVKDKAGNPPVFGPRSVRSCSPGPCPRRTRQ
jgi:amidase